MSQRLPFQDRRKRPTPPISRYLFWGRRRKPAPGVGDNYYVDRPARWAWQSALLLIALSVTDAILSLQLFSDGRFHELNPLLHIGLQKGSGVFLGLKLTLTFTAVLVLLLHANFVIARRRVRVAWVIWTLIATYGLIVTYEIALLSL
ncbi:MAG: DUF5658 family protein [Acidobacteriota bacterium]|jgi:hypothetical protein